MRFIALVVGREWLELRRSPLVIGTLTLMPLALVLLPLGLLLALGAGLTSVQIASLQGLSTQFANLHTAEDVEMGLLNQFVVAFLLLPVILPLSIATTSVVGEKQGRSLEPVLATPLPTWALLIGKCIAAVLPSVVATWMGYAAFVAGTHLIAGPAIASALGRPVWIATMLVLVPSVCWLVVSIGLAISARVNDIRAAQNLSSLLILPLNGAFIAQALGKIELGLHGVFLEAFVVALAAIGTTTVATRLFDRDNILSRWG